MGHMQLVTAVLALGEIELLGQARHTAVEVAAMVAEYVPDPQFVHEAEPVAVLYLPVAQAVQGPPSGPV